MSHRARACGRGRHGAAAHEPRAPAGGIAIQVVGGFELTVAGGPVVLSGGVQRLVAFLALQDRAVRRGYVAGSLWPDVPEERAGAGLRTALWKLGRTGLALVEGTQTLRLARAVHVDLHPAVETAHRAIRLRGALTDAERELPAALYADVLPDWHEDWVAVERERFREVRVRALEAVSGHLVELRRFDEAALTALAAIRAEPLRESAYRALIAVHLSEGNRLAAARQFQRLRWLLNRELGIEPSRHTVSMIGEVVRPGAWVHAEQVAG